MGVLGKTAEKDWFDCVAEGAGADTDTIKAVLDSKGIRPSPLRASPRRLVLREIYFSGKKTGVPNAGPFEFRWRDLDRGLYAMLTEANLKGKSSVLEIVRWMLRGRASGNLQEDVREWISGSRLGFDLDDTSYEVSLETVDDSSRGRLLKKGNGADGVELSSFHSDSEFEAVMSEFFMREFALESVARWRGSPGEDRGTAVIHGWASLSGAMFIGTAYSSLLGDTPPKAGLATPLMQMYLGLPWISTLTKAKAAESQIKQERQANERQEEAEKAAKMSRVRDLEGQLEVLNGRLAQMVPVDESRKALEELSGILVRLRREEQDADRRLSREQEAVSLAQAAYKEDLREHQALLDAAAAGAVFRRLAPSICPRCDTAITEERKKLEKSEKTCFVCGGLMTAGEDFGGVLSTAEARVLASKQALRAALEGQDKAQRGVAVIKSRIRAASRETETRVRQLDSVTDRNRLELDVAIMRGRLEEAKRDIEHREIPKDEAKIIEATVAETAKRVKKDQTKLLRLVSERIAYYAIRFGMENLEWVNLKGNATLQIRKGGETTTYSKVTRGEKLRLKVATVLAMISVAEKCGVGRHPGLLMIDSPGAQESSSRDLDQLVAGLKEVSSEFKHLQVFIAAKASREIQRHVAGESTRIAYGDEPLW